MPLPASPKALTRPPDWWAERERNALETQLKNAVDSENYEEAARLRDELKKLSA